MNWNKLLLLTVLAVVLIFVAGFLMKTFGVDGNADQVMGKVLGTIVGVLIVVVVLKRLLGR